MTWNRDSNYGYTKNEICFSIGVEKGSLIEK